MGLTGAPSGPGSAGGPAAPVALRRARAGDIPRLAALRLSVRENRLADPAAVTAADYAWFVARRRVWLAEAGGVLHGFAASDPRDGTIWALFVDPACEGRGTGTALLARACADLAADGHRRAALSTDPGTRAEAFYIARGWTPAGTDDRGERRFTKALP